MARADCLIWIDLEMTGLVPETDRIIEIATVVTDADLAMLAEGPVIAVRQPETALAAMDAWNTRTHGASGLVDRVRASHLDDGAAERATLADERSAPVDNRAEHVEDESADRSGR